jgi:aspartate/methionine/tyrosine aminotransferase
MKLRDFQIERFFAKYEFEVPYILCASDCESFTIEEILQLEENATDRFKKLKLCYTDSAGSPQLRQAIASLYDSHSESDILAFSGAEEGIFAFMNVVLEPGDHIVVQFPAYQSLFEVALSIGCRVTKWSMSPKDNWDLDIDFLNENITPKTKAIIINFPHNPTGALLTKKKLLSVIEIARENELYLFSDEVYRFLEYSAEKQLPAASDLYEKALSLGVLSKSFGLAGLRIGWISTQDNHILNRLASFKDYTTICNSVSSEFLATIALKNKQTLVTRNLEIILSNLKLLDNFFQNNSLFQWIRPLAGPIAFPQINSDILIDDFCSDLVIQSGVLLLPGSNFDFGDKHFRIGFGRKDFPNGLEVLKDYINHHY